MGSECDVVHGGKRVIGLQRFGVEHVEAGVADTAAPQPIDERVGAMKKSSGLVLKRSRAHGTSITASMTM